MSQSPSTQGDTTIPNGLTVWPSGKWWQGPKIWLAAISFAVVYALVDWLWYSRFINGEASGPYWVMMVFSWSLIPLMGTMILLVPLVVIGRATWLSARKLPGPRMLWHPLAASIVAGILLLPAGFAIMITPFRHADTKMVRGQRFHLAQIYALIDINYGLYRCDEWGLWCTMISRSGDYSSSDGHLETDPASGEVLIVVCEDYTSTPECKSIPTYRP